MTCYLEFVLMDLALFGTFPEYVWCKHNQGGMLVWKQGCQVQNSAGQHHAHLGKRTAALGSQDCLSVSVCIPPPHTHTQLYSKWIEINVKISFSSVSLKPQNVREMTGLYIWNPKGMFRIDKRTELSEYEGSRVLSLCRPPSIYFPLSFLKQGMSPGA